MDPIDFKIKMKTYSAASGIGIQYKKEPNWIGHILRSNYLLKHVIKGKVKEGQKWREDEEKDLISQWMTLKTG
jgi:hypothetical protein